jgi:hypothetical protein
MIAGFIYCCIKCSKKKNKITDKKINDISEIMKDRAVTPTIYKDEI